MSSRLHPSGLVLLVLLLLLMQALEAHRRQVEYLRVVLLDLLAVGWRVSSVLRRGVSPARLLAIVISLLNLLLLGVTAHNLCVGAALTLVQGRLARRTA